MSEIESANLSVMNELKILRSLQHENCIKFIASFEDEHAYFFVTELLDFDNSLQQELSKYQNP